MLYAYPQKTLLNRTLPKSTIYKNVAPSSKQRDLLTQQVEKIIWSNKLAPDTLNINASAEVPEIQIFYLRLKPQVEAINEAVLQYLDKAIPSVLIFEVESDNGIQVVACLKQKNQNGTLNMSPYLYSPLMSVDAPRQELPISRDFLQLYQQLLAKLLPYPLRKGESLNDALERSQKLQALEKTIKQLETQLLKKTTPFNKRIEINKQLRQAKQAFMQQSAE